MTTINCSNKQTCYVHTSHPYVTQSHAFVDTKPGSILPPNIHTGSTLLKPKSHPPSNWCATPTQARGSIHHSPACLTQYPNPLCHAACPHLSGDGFYSADNGTVCLQSTACSTLQCLVAGPCPKQTALTSLLQPTHQYGCRQSACNCHRSWV